MFNDCKLSGSDDWFMLVISVHGAIFVYYTPEDLLNLWF